MGHTYSAAKYFTVAYEKLGDSSYTTIGNYTGSATSMTQSRYIPADSGSNNPKSTLFRIKITGVTDSTTVTPILLSFSLRAILYPTRRKFIACTVTDAQEIVTKNGIVDKAMAAKIATTIDNALDATWPVTINDIDETSRTVKLLPLGLGQPRYSPVAYEKGRTMEKHYNLLMQITPTS